MQVDSPIGTIQPELISEIFICTVSSSPSFSSFSPREVYAPLRTALLLSSVSRTWRAIAHSTPSLWSFLGFETKDIFRTSGGEMFFRPSVYRIFPKMELVERWMERSRAYPLDLAMCTRNRLETAREPDEEGEQRVVELVRRNHGRIRSLQIVCNPSLTLGLQVLNSLVEEGHTMPKLEVLTVELEHRKVTLLEPLILGIPYSNRLLELNLDLRVDIRIDTIFPSKSFERLRSLTIKTKEFSPYLDTDHVLGILAGCSATLVFFFWDTNDFSPPSTYQQHITLPALSSLRTSTLSDPSPFFTLLTLPSLTDLHIFEYVECDFNIAFHPGLLSRSLCPSTGKTKLEDIHVETNLDVPPPQILEILRISPDLETFLFTTPLTEELALSLVINETDLNSEAGESSLAPHLNDMKFTRGWEWDDVLLVEAIAKMVLSRWGGPSGLFPGKGALELVRVEVVYEEDARVMYEHAGLKKCIEEGFELRLVSF